MRPLISVASPILPDTDASGLMVKTASMVAKFASQVPTMSGGGWRAGVISGGMPNASLAQSSMKTPTASPTTIRTFLGTSQPTPADLSLHQHTTCSNPIAAGTRNSPIPRMPIRSIRTDGSQRDRASQPLPFPGEKQPHHHGAHGQDRKTFPPGQPEDVREPFSDEECQEEQGHQRARNPRRPAANHRCRAQRSFQPPHNGACPLVGLSQSSNISVTSLSRPSYRHTASPPQSSPPALSWQSPASPAPRPRGCW